jgi:hypothetical protein
MIFKSKNFLASNKKVIYIYPFLNLITVEWKLEKLLFGKTFLVIYFLLQYGKKVAYQAIMYVLFRIPSFFHGFHVLLPESDMQFSC